MSYATVLVHLETGGDSTDRIRYATELAREFEANLIGFAASDVRPIIATDGGVPIDGEYLAKLREENLKRLEELKQIFLSIAGDRQNTSWRQFEYRPTRALMINARAADLIVSGTPNGASAEDTDNSVDPGILICGAGRPVLLVADKVKFRRPQNAVVGWKDTAQSRRALLDALPFLRLAANVLVVTINDHDSQDAESDLADVVQYLTHHGIIARSEVIEDGGKAVDQFVDIATREDADILVSGAYGHSRLRELVFGGFTRALLNEDGFNRLMAS